MISYTETKSLIELALQWDIPEARSRMFHVLSAKGLDEGKFHTAIVAHGPGMLSSEQWCELLCRYPNQILRSQLEVEKFLSPEQIARINKFRRLR